MITGRTAAPLAAVLALLVGGTACGTGRGEGSGDDVLRIAMPSPGEEQLAVWNDVKKEFEKSHPDMTVQINVQKDDLYQSVGLSTLLTGRRPPDIYFEWVGDRLATRVEDGFAADLTSAVGSGPLKGVLDAGAYERTTVDRKIVMVPFASDVTNVLWYNTEVLDDAGVRPPRTWQQLLAACDTLRAHDVTPIASGNKDLWPAGNWLAHVVSRVVGEKSYADVLSGKASPDTPQWRTAFDRVAELHDHGCVNDSANAINDTEGMQMFFQGRAAMHPIGSWLVSLALDEAPDLDLDFVNLPRIPGAGDQSSVIGVETGYVVNAHSKKTDEAAEFLALLHSRQHTDAFVRAGVTPVAATGPGDPTADRLTRLLERAPTVVLPPDTGYQLKRADALYRALAAVLGGAKSPQDALGEAADAMGRAGS